MAIEASYEELIIAIRKLSKNQQRILAIRYPPSYITNFFNGLRRDIAEEAVVRVKSKIAAEFTGGYATGALFNSIYYLIQDGRIVIKSTKTYFKILNEGFESFDMKEALRKSGKPIPMRLPGGRIIFRRVGTEDDSFTPTRRENLIQGPIRNRQFMTKKNDLRKFISTKNWIHPGVQGKHIYEDVENEMQPWIKRYVADEIWALLIAIPDIPFAQTQEGLIYYSQRNNKGQFTPFR